MRVNRAPDISETQTMSKPPFETPEAVEAQTMGERPDLGRTPDALVEALSGSGMGSDTRAGSLQGGAASGSDADPDQAEVDRRMADIGRDHADRQASPQAAPDAVVNTGPVPGQQDRPGADGLEKDAEAATG